MSTAFESVSTAQMVECVDQGEATLIDVRPIDAYNGWPQPGQRRGGHLPGARTLPAHWAGYIDWIEIVRDKGLAPKQPLIIYGADDGDVDRVASQFRRAGFDRVSVYRHFADQWCERDELPLATMPRYRYLVSPHWLADRQQADDRSVVVCHCHYRNPGDYDQGHVPGALALDTNWLESAETWNRRNPTELRAVLERLGIRVDSTVVLYGRFSHPRNSDPFPGSSAGHLGAFRCAFILMYAGVRDVRMLNGGMQGWQDAGMPVSTDAVEPEPAVDFGAEIPGRPELAVDVPEARLMLAADDANLVCVRSYPELIGEVSGYNYIEKKGRIPGAVFANCGSDAYHMENYRNLDHTTREYAEVEAEWRRLGITPDRHNAFYCGTGWRGSEAFFNAWLLGWNRIAVFDGGWFEWSSDPSNPVETGIPEAMA